LTCSGSRIALAPSSIQQKESGGASRPLRQTLKVPQGAFFVAVSSKTVHGFCGHFRVNLKSIWASVACKPRNSTRSLLRAKNTPTFSFLTRGRLKEKLTASGSPASACGSWLCRGFNPRGDFSLSRVGSKGAGFFIRCWV
jgi:hypothetical protein